MSVIYGFIDWVEDDGAIAEYRSRRRGRRAAYLGTFCANLAIPSAINVQTVVGNVANGVCGNTAISAGQPVSVVSGGGGKLQPAGCNTGTASDATVVGVATDNAQPGQSVYYQTSGTLQLNAGTNATQLVTISGSPTGGTFTLIYGGVTSSAIPYNATAAQVQTALLGMSSIGGVGPGATAPTGLTNFPNVTCSGSALPAGTVTVTFQANLGGQPITAMTAGSGGLTGGSSPTASAATGTTGTATIAAGTSYVLSATAGSVAVNSDLTTGNIVSQIGFGGQPASTVPGIITLGIQNTGITHA